MILESGKLFSSKDHWAAFFIIIVVCLALHIAYLHSQYKTFTQEPVIQLEASIMNIYEKKRYDVVKLYHEGVYFYTSLNKGHGFKKLQYLSLAVITTKVDFLGYLKGFYVNSFNHYALTKSNIPQQLLKTIHSQHENEALRSLFAALFLAVPLSESLRAYFASLGLSHLIAISGFHVGILSGCLYVILNAIFKPIHQYCCPYVNRSVGIGWMMIGILFFYVYLTHMAPSLLRSFVMFTLALLLIRFNIKLLSFETLLFVIGLILVLFPKYMFSLSLWFSLTGVFYIYLFLRHFSSLNKWIQIGVFNVWIFAAFNPIVHYFFPQTSLYQLFSPLVTVCFTLFYPLELLLHLMGIGHLLDEYLLKMVSFDITVTEMLTPLWFFALYILLSLASIFSSYAFMVLNGVMVIFNLFLYSS
jgi:competence protein ComEC